MNVIFKLAFRNLIGAGIRTWLNVFVLSLSYVLIIWTQGLYDGLGAQSTKLMVDHDIAGGQYWARDFDPYDPLSLDRNQQKIPDELNKKIQNKDAVSILIKQATIYPNGRFRPAILKGIEPDQTILKLPTHLLKHSEYDLPILIGKRMAKSLSMTTGDRLMIRWRDKNGGFDAAEATIVAVFQMNVPSIDSGQVWLSQARLNQMMGLNDVATIITVSPKLNELGGFDRWNYHSQDDLLVDVKTMVRNEKFGASILYVILMTLACIGIFDSQILSLFKRRKEIGTLMALGMTRLKVIQLFTLEGVFNGVLAGIISAIYGGPLCYFTWKNGLDLGNKMDNYSMAISSVMFPVYTLKLVIMTGLIIMLMITLISYLPMRSIRKVNPTNALKGKWL